LGKPTHVEGNMHYWAVMEGKEKCTYTKVEKDHESNHFAPEDKKDPQPIVGLVAKAASMETDGYNWVYCIEAAGVKPEDLEDPNAPVPGEGITSIEDFRAGIAGAKSKWVDKEITVEGVFISTSVSTSGSNKSVSISIAKEAGSRDSISCKVADESVTEGLTQGSEIKVKGKASATFGGRLEECEIL
jgi:hypothetical protein